MNQSELAATLNAAATQVGKVRTEVQNLKDIITNQGNVTPEVEAAMNALTEAIQGVDDLNEDAAGTPTEG